MWRTQHLEGAADQASGISKAKVGLSALDGIPEWTAATIESALKHSVVDGLNIKPRKAFAPVRVAVTGRTVSPPLYESMELLGRDAWVFGDSRISLRGRSRTR